MIVTSSDVGFSRPDAMNADGVNPALCMIVAWPVESNVSPTVPAFGICGICVGATGSGSCTMRHVPPESTNPA